jgi:cytidine deaminase
MDKKLEEAFELAKQVNTRAYAPYSGLKVSAVVKLRGDDTLYPGNNVENAVNGASVCAERSAVSNFVSHAGAKAIEWVVVLSSKSGEKIAPCGVCRQVLFEFCDDLDVPIYMFADDGTFDRATIGELLPMVYKGKDFLKNY